MHFINENVPAKCDETVIWKKTRSHQKELESEISVLQTWDPQ